MFKKSVVTALMAFALMGAVPAVSVASGGGGTSGGGGGTSGGGGSGSGGGGGGGGGGTPTPGLPAPAIAPGTFDGIGPGPVYIHDSFGWAQGTRFAQDGSIADILHNQEIDGIRAEFPNNATESWFGVTGHGAPSWKLTSISEDPFEPYTPLQDSPTAYIDGALSIVGAEVGAVDTRPNALLPFAAPTDSASTVSGDIVAFVGKTAIGFSNSNATTENFETNGQAWLELETPGGATGPLNWTFHTNGLSGSTLSGTFTGDASGFNRVAVSYDPVNHVAAATINGTVVASVPYAASSVKYVGVEGSLNGNVDNFTVRAGTVNDPPPESVAPPPTPVTSRF